MRDHSEFLLRPRYAKIINADWRSVSMGDLDKSLEVLVKAGIIKTPEYWQNNAVKGGNVKGENAATLIHNIAKKLGV
ncbi:hypothetical protein [Brevibacillus laterosporus]|uniref:Uncharacterized protein n=2 Tax=Brevibacillus laterosporus TaxID=1465 RepID=A0AAP3GC87_BRELA|nr:hypothetical protein [Brevibacillus laterosporus]MCR8978643.1 hypothetical protein [Brevibacillus laterosporus]MCZ0805799.1 hypothetical protein [Brevibacillus laterosporus]MCZ0824435.1 hypothetical protein [Brevibacillus laterosporus]MCZ0848339.1 hypothetical protein [Brevibacillus laterosporus]PPB10933.1 hypothetical protein C4A77_04735 [Brevibacillus laterosporus]